MTELKVDHTSLDKRFSNFEGAEYERRIRNRLMYRVTMQFGLNAPGIAMAHDIPSSPRLTSVIHRAIQSGAISREQAEDLHEADIIIADSDNRYVVVEASITADDIAAQHSGSVPTPEWV